MLLTADYVRWLEKLPCRGPSNIWSRLSRSQLRMREVFLNSLERPDQKLWQHWEQSASLTTSGERCWLAG